MTRCSAPQDHPRGGGETGARLRRCDSAVSKGPGTASGTRAVLMAQGWSPGVRALVTRPLTLQTGDSRDQWRAKTLPHPLTLRMTSSPLHRARTEVFFFSPFFKKLGVVNKGTEPSASFPHQEGIRSRKGGHFDKSCELRWVPGNFLAHLGLPELLPQRAASSPPGPRESVSPSTGAAGRAAGRRVGGAWTGAAAPSPSSLPACRRQKVLSPPPGGGSQKTGCCV